MSSLSEDLKQRITRMSLSFVPLELHCEAVKNLKELEPEIDETYMGKKVFAKTEKQIEEKTKKQLKKLTRAHKSAQKGAERSVFSC